MSIREGRYRIPPDLNVWSDVSEFRDALDRADFSRTSVPERAALLQQAVDLYSGPFLPDVYSDWAETKRRELESRYLRALSALAQSRMALGDVEGALRLLERVAAIDPYHDGLFLEFEGWSLPPGQRPWLLESFRRSLDRLRAGEDSDGPVKRLSAPDRRPDPHARR